MLIWAVFAAMTAVAALCVLAPLARRRPDAAVPAAPVARGGSDVAVYEDQLGEIDRDVAAGLVAPGEAEAARAEIARRLLRAARRPADRIAAVAPRRALAVAVAAVLLLPLISVGTYLVLGRPDLRDLPLAERRSDRPDGQSIEELVTRVEAHLAKAPNDVRGWEVIAPVYLRLGRSQDAADAWSRAIALGGADERRQNGLGEALTAVAGGIVTADARVAFEKSLELEPAGVLPKMYLALALFQEGRLSDAAAAWRRLIDGADPEAPWLPTARAELGRVETALAPAKPGSASPATPAPAAPPAGPSAAEVDAAAAMTPAERAAMIESMVDRLDARLKASGGSLDEWLRLIDAQKKLGRLDAARTALDRARTALAGDPEAIRRLDAAAAGLATP